MTADEEQSLSDQHTFQGQPGGSDDSPQSLGDQATFGDASSGGEAVVDDGMQVTDLDDRYITEAVLGKGGMGEVLLATDMRLERKVAIKRMLGDAAKSRTAVSRFLTEAKSIAALNHPNIVQIYDYGRAADGPFLIMEYVEGSSLLEKCREGALELEEAVELTCQLCDGLAKAHDANIIHRDIKPANILLTPDGVPKLTDFGLAKDETADSGLSVAGAVLGTLDFMPPEQRKDVALTDSRSDLWSLAATLYQMVTGEPPRVIDLDDVPQQLRPVLAKALKSKPDARFQTIEVFREALASVQTADAEVTPGSAESQPASEPAELASGECPQCHAQNNLSRKFCHGCGESLRVQCLSCKADISIWEKFCGECGGDQATLVEEREAEQRLADEISRIDEWTNSIGMTFRLIQPGTFTMGEGKADSHQVTLTEPFHLGIYAVTQEQYGRVMRTNPSKFKGVRNAVENVSWDDAVEFCRKLSALPAEKSAGCVYRLPTEAEWEYACRAGTTTVYSFGDSAAQLGQYAWFNLNSTYPRTGGFLENLFSKAQTFHHPVGEKKPNPWGLYDMHGNVWEWCQDWYGDYPSGAATDPTGPSAGSLRVNRGGSWFNDSERCGSACRYWSTPGLRYYNLGFRVLRSSVQ